MAEDTAATAASTAAPGRERGAMSRWQLTTVVVVLLSGQLLSALEQSIIGTALPTIVGDLGSLADLSLVVSAYLLVSTVSTALFGKLADLYGPKPMYITSIVVFTAGSLLVGLSRDMTQMVIFRAVQGLGAGGLVVLAFTICASVMPPRQLGRIQGLVGGLYALMSFVGPVLGGVFTEYLSWRWCFFLNVPVGLVGAVAVAALLRLPPSGRPARMDYPGAALLTGGVALLTLISVWGGTRYDWGSPQVLGLLAAFVVVAVAFVLRQRSAPDPILPLGVFRMAEISLAMIITFVSGVGLLGAYTFLPVYLQLVRGLEPVAAGLSLLPLMLAVMVGSGGSGWLIATVLGRSKPVIVLGAGLMTASLYLFSLLDAQTPAVLFWAYEVVMGVGLGMVISKLIIAVQNRVERRDLGTITAQANFFRLIGAAIGTAALGTVLASRLTVWQQRLPGAGGAGGLLPGGSILGVDPATVRGLAATAPAVHADVVEAVTRSLQTVFLVATPVMGVAFLLTFFLPNTALRSDGHAPGGPQESAAPAPDPAPGGTT